MTKKNLVTGDTYACKSEHGVGFVVGDFVSIATLRNLLQNEPQSYRTPSQV